MKTDRSMKEDPQVEILRMTVVLLEDPQADNFEPGS